MQHELMPATGRHTYESGAQIIAHAARKFGVCVDEELEDEWRNILKVVHELDSVLDSPMDLTERESRYDSLVQYIVNPNDQGISPEVCACSVCQLQIKASGWNDRKRTGFLHVTNTAKEIAFQKRNEKSARRLGQLVLIEGRLCANLFTHFDNNRLANHLFKDWVGDLISGGTALDTAIDLPEDYALGLTQVRPKAVNRALIFSMGVPYATRALLREPSVVKTFSKAVGAVIDDKNRFTETATGNLS